LELAMNHSIHSADRATHVKIVLVALIAGTLVAGVGIAARVTGQDSAQIEARIPVIKAGAPVAVSSNTAVRTVR
jgi:hypothetical protein